MCYLFFLAVALHAAGGVVLGLAEACGDHRLGSVPAHLSWWVGLRWGYPRRPEIPFEARKTPPDLSGGVRILSMLKR